MAAGFCVVASGLGRSMSPKCFVRHRSPPRCAGCSIRRSCCTQEPGVSAVAQPRSATPGWLVVQCDSRSRLPRGRSRRWMRLRSDKRLPLAGAAPRQTTRERQQTETRNQACSAPRRHLALGYNSFAVLIATLSNSNHASPAIGVRREAVSLFSRKSRIPVRFPGNCPAGGVL